MLGIKKYLLKMENSMVALDKSFEPNQNKTQKPLKLANFGPTSIQVAKKRSKYVYASVLSKHKNIDYVTVGPNWLHFRVLGL